MTKVDDTLYDKIEKRHSPLRSTAREIATQLTESYRLLAMQSHAPFLYKLKAYHK